MSRQGIVNRARRAADLGMRDRCVIRRETGSTVDDEGREVSTFDVIYGPDVLPHAGRCRVQQGSVTGAAGSTTVGEDQQFLVPIEIQLPILAPELRVDDEVEMISSADDPQLAGQKYAVRDLFGKTDASSRRIGVTRRTS